MLSEVKRRIGIGARRRQLPRRLTRWSSSPTYLRERVADVHAGVQVRRVLAGGAAHQAVAGDPVARDLTPAETAGLDISW
jgi:hypothetical protein